MVRNIRYRFVLKGKIHSSGYRSVREFCTTNNINESQMSRVIQGRETPDKPLINSMAKGLRINGNEIVNLIDCDGGNSNE